MVSRGLISLAMTGAALVALPACSGGRDAPTGQPEPMAASAPTPVPAAAAKRPVAVAEPERGYVAVVVPRESADVTARVSGQLASVGVRVGDRVTAGSSLAVVDATVIREELAIARARLRASRAELARAKTSAREARSRWRRRRKNPDIVPGEEVEGARYALRSAHAGKKRAAADVEEQAALVARLERQLGEVELVAPFTGTVSTRYVDPGNMVESGTLIVRVISDDRLLVRFAVPGSERSRVSVGDSVEVKLDGRKETVRATVRQLAPELDPATQMVFAEAELTADADQPDVHSGQVGRVFAE